MKHLTQPARVVTPPDDGWLARRVARLLKRLPPAAGAPVSIARAPRLRDGHAAVHAGSFLRQRRMLFACTCAEFPRVFVHEWFHFVWLRAGNPLRREFEELVAAERRAGARGELGWSAEWRKRALTRSDARRRSRRWREYCCESFCDTAAWIYSGARGHAEFTLARRFRTRRREWFAQKIAHRPLSI